MKPKNKIVVLLEIAIVLCSMFLVALPAITAEQNTQKVSASTITTASEDDYVLDIYGNANEDDTIDMGDVVYTKLAIFRKKPQTELCDAKCDGRINVLDVIQTKLIILGKEKELTLIDSPDRIVTVNTPIERLVICSPQALEVLRSLKVPTKDLIVGIVTAHIDTGFFPEFSDVPSVGYRHSPDIEAILNLHPDTVIIGSEHARALESAGITVLTSVSSHQEPYWSVKKLAYVFGKCDEAEEYLEWRENILNSIKEKAENIPEEDKPKVYFESGFTFNHYYTHRYAGDFIKAGGGKNIFEGMSGTIDAEAVIDQNPDIIVKSPPWKTYDYDPGGYHLDVGDTTEIRESWDDVMGRPELQKVKAVEEGEVYIISVHLLTFFWSSGHRYPIAYAYMAKWFHPELFEDLDPQAIHQEYLTKFQGLDIDLDKKGVFVYHPEEHPEGQ